MRRVRKAVAASVIIGMAAFGRGPIIDAFTPPSAQEILLDEVVRSTGSGAEVHCLSPEEINFRLWPYRTEGKPSGYASAPFKLIWLNQRFCDGLESFLHSPDKSSPTDVQVESVRALGHEYAHIVNWTFNESKTECYSVQYADELARTLGATTAESQTMRAEVSRIVSDYDVPGYVLPPNSCYDGSANDLDPQHAGIFPQQPPSATPQAFMGW